MNSMIRQAQKMQEDLAALQEELDAREYTVSAGGGAVTVVIDGTKCVKSITVFTGRDRPRRSGNAPGYTLCGPSMKR